MLVAFYGRPRTRDVANAPAGFCRPWPDVEYAAGANPAGMLVDLFGIRSAIATVGGVALLSAPIVATAMYETAACRRED